MGVRPAQYRTEGSAAGLAEPADDAASDKNGKWKRHRVLEVSHALRIVGGITAFFLDRHVDDTTVMNVSNKKLQKRCTMMTYCFFCFFVLG